MPHVSTPNCIPVTTEIPGERTIIGDNKHGIIPRVALGDSVHEPLLQPSTIVWCPWRVLAQGLLRDEPRDRGQSAIHCVCDKRIEGVVIEISDAIVVQRVTWLRVQEALEELGEQILAGNVVVVLIKSPWDTGILKVLIQLVRLWFSCTVVSNRKEKHRTSPAAFHFKGQQSIGGSTMSQAGPNISLLSSRVVFHRLTISARILEQGASVVTGLQAAGNVYGAAHPWGSASVSGRVSDYM